MPGSGKTRASILLAAGVLVTTTALAGSASAATQASGSAKSTAVTVVAQPAAVSPALDPNGYPWPSVDPNTYISDGHGYYEGECTSFAAWAIRSDGLGHSASPDSMGNADTWHGSASSSTPQVGEVAQWDDNHAGAGGTGHVAYVSAVYGDGTIQVEEYNWYSAANNYTGHRYNTRRIAATDPSRYLQF